MASTINTFTKSGKVLKHQTGSGPLASLGKFDPATGRVYQHPRLQLDPLSGGSVRVTNPAATGVGRNKRTASLGMGAVGQRGRSRDIPGQAA